MDSVVYITRGNTDRPLPRKVVLGASDNVNTEILSGVGEGDRIVTGGWPPPAETDSSGDRNNGAQL